MRDEVSKSPVIIAALPIGQGDAILIRWVDEDRSWTCLVDGGESASKLQESLKKLSVDHLDLLVVTHLDSDHIAGLGEWITQDPASFPTVDCYWGPALAAFERHKWLFGKRCAAALERGRKLEDALRARDESLPILYPLEGFTSAPWGGTGPSIEVLNPPGRLIERLLTAEDISELLTTETTPMGWLLQPEPSTDEEAEDPPPPAAFAQGLAQRVLDPASLEKRQSDQGKVDPAALATSVQAAYGVDPLFFGNQLFNNSSIVLWLELPVGARRYTALLPGDLENWTYLIARHQKGLQPDLLKAPHHGGRVYIEGVSGTAINTLHRFLRPRAVLVSSIGGHGLPHEETRDAWIRWGASVLCTCKRRYEAVVGPPPRLDRCCTLNHVCSPHEDAMLVGFDEKRIMGSHPACHSGFGDAAAPPVIVHQQVVNPSPALEILGDLELRRYLTWVRKKLRAIHEDRIANGASQTSRVVSETDLATMAAAEHHKIGPLATHIVTVLDAGMKRGAVWSARRHESHRDQLRIAYARPTAQETQALVRELREIGLVAWPHASETIVGDRDTFVLGLGHKTLAEWARSRWGFPVETFPDLLLPSVLVELRKPEWSILAHPNGGVLMIRGKTLSRFETMLQAFRQPSSSRSWSLRVAFGRACQTEERSAQLEELLERSKMPKNYWGNDKQSELDKNLRELLARWEGISLPNCAAWTLRYSSPIVGPNFILGGQRVVLGESRFEAYALVGKIKEWLRPTPTALHAAGYARVETYEEILEVIVKYGAHWCLNERPRSSWCCEGMQIQFDGNHDVRISTLDPSELDASVMAYAKLVLASFKALT